MGNWRRVKIEGTCSAEDLPALKKAVNIGDDSEKFHCLCNTGAIFGINDWTGTKIDAVGNLAESNYDIIDVIEQVKELAKVAPSLSIMVHIGGNYENKNCVATVVCENGEVSSGEPRIKEIPDIPESQIDAAWEAIMESHK